MTFAQVIENINHTRRARYTDFFFEDDFYYCSPKGCTKEQARKVYAQTFPGRKVPRIEECFWFVAE